MTVLSGPEPMGPGACPGRARGRGRSRCPLRCCRGRGAAVAGSAGPGALGPVVPAGVGSARFRRARYVGRGGERPRRCCRICWGRDRYVGRGHAGAVGSAGAGTGVLGGAAWTGTGAGDLSSFPPVRPE